MKVRYIKPNESAQAQTLGKVYELIKDSEQLYYFLDDEGESNYNYCSYSDSFEVVEQKKSALDIQEGGGHYKSKGIQPVEYAYRNNLGFIESNVVKYVSRWKEKSGIQDLKKARHYLDILIEFEEQKEDK